MLKIQLLDALNEYLQGKKVYAIRDLESAFDNLDGTFCITTLDNMVYTSVPCEVL